jgi:hypothetical protein
VEIRLSRKTAQAIGITKFKRWCDNEESWRWEGTKSISLAAMSAKELDAFEKIFDDAVIGTAGVNAIKRDIATWRSALKGSDSAKPRAVRHLRPLLIRYLGRVPGHRVYSKFDSDQDLWLAHYVNEIEYHPEENRKDYRRPAYVTMDLLHEAFAGRTEHTVHFGDDDCVGYTVPEALARKGYYVETKQLRDDYLRQVKRFGETVPRVGTQFLAVGRATDDLDGNDKRDSSWYWRQTNEHQLEKDGVPSRVVIDVFREDEKEDNHRDVHVDTWFWASATNERLIAAEKKEENEDLEINELAETEDVERPVIEVPIHPFVAVFDLKRHLRLRVHLEYLTEYKYDPTIAEKLILPAELKDLVKMLIHHRGKAFTDIIQHKSGGAIVLLTGAPGTGKTLTAEVYAECEGRALYSVQCSQLGTDPNELEDALLKVFARAKRWNAVTLLDEADVYVHERGDDLTQNAIVGVFLRILEYQDTVLFLTTNRPNDVDDAIASRCVARLDYQAPDAAQQRRIWRVLADSAKIELSDVHVRTIVANSEGATGRDVKNLLKLADLMAKEQKGKITPATVELVKRFKPTGKRK